MFIVLSPLLFFSGEIRNYKKMDQVKVREGRDQQTVVHHLVYPGVCLTFMLLSKGVDFYRGWKRNISKANKI